MSWKKIDANNFENEVVIESAKLDKKKDAQKLIKDCLKLSDEQLKRIQSIPRHTDPRESLLRDEANIDSLIVELEAL